MNKRLNEAISRVQTLPDDQQREIADLLFGFLDAQQADVGLTPEQITEIERLLSDDEPFATEAEVKTAFDRLTK